MARYTLNVSEICGTITNQDVNEIQGNAFDYIDDIIEEAIPFIFSQRLNIYDNAEDRQELYRKILEHYWEYEICTYTPAEFIRRLNRKLREIMPYYNQLYATEKVKFDPLIDIDYWKIGHNTESGDTAGPLNSDVAHTGTDQDNTQHRGHDDTSTAKTGADTVETDTDFNTNRDNTERTVLDGETSNTSETKDVKTVTIDRDGTANNTTDVTDKTVTNSETDTTGQRNETGKVETDNITTDNGSNNKSGTHTSTITDVAGGTEYDYYNDTPQGMTAGIDNGYLTHYEKHVKSGPTNTRTDSGTSSENATITNRNVLDGEQKSTNSMAESGSSETDTTTNVTGKTISAGTTTEDVTESTNDKINVSGATTTDNITNVVGNVNGEDTTESTSTTTYGNNTDTVLTLNSDYNTDHIYDSNIGTTQNTTGEYSSEGNEDVHISGKFNSGRTYAEMIAQWREILLNIDMQVIEAIKPLFFKII